MNYERRDLPNVLLAELARLSHALPILRCTNGAVSNIRALYVNFGAREALIVVDAIGRAFIARDRTRVGTVHEHKRIRTRLKTTNRDERACDASRNMSVRQQRLCGDAAWRSQTASPHYRL